MVSLSPSSWPSLAGWCGEELLGGGDFFDGKGRVGAFLAGTRGDWEVGEGEGEVGGWRREGGGGGGPVGSGRIPPVIGRADTTVIAGRPPLTVLALEGG